MIGEDSLMRSQLVYAVAFVAEHGVFRADRIGMTHHCNATTYST